MRDAPERLSARRSRADTLHITYMDGFAISDVGQDDRRRLRA